MFPSFTGQKIDEKTFRTLNPGDRVRYGYYFQVMNKDSKSVRREVVLGDANIDRVKYYPPDPNGLPDPANLHEHFGGRLHEIVNPVNLQSPSGECTLSNGTFIELIFNEAREKLNGEFFLELVRKKRKK